MRIAEIPVLKCIVMALTGPIRYSSEALMEAGSTAFTLNATVPCLRYLVTDG